MFPDDTEELIQNELNEVTDASSTFNGRTFLYDFKKGDFIYRNGAPIEVTGIEALKVWIEKAIRTEKFRFNIYNFFTVEGEEVDYGVSIEDLIGSNLPHSIIDSELKRELSESILKNPYIDALEEWSFVRDGSKLTISFTVITNGEAFEMEVAA